MAVARQTSVRIDQAKLMRLIERAIESPKARATLARVANDESRKIVVIAKELAEAELHRRPVNRRTKESLEHGAEYHDSFVIIPADTSNPSKVRAGITNTHPAAGIIENGSPPHYIIANTKSVGLPLGPALHPGWHPPSAGQVRQLPAGHQGFVPRRLQQRPHLPYQLGAAPRVGAEAHPRPSR